MNVQLTPQMTTIQEPDLSVLVNGKNIGKIVSHADFPNHSRYRAVLDCLIPITATTPTSMPLVQGYGSTPEESLKTALIQGIQSFKEATKMLHGLCADIGIDIPEGGAA